MNIKMRLSVASLLATAAMSNATAQNQPDTGAAQATTCSVETLKGNYAYSIQGYRDGIPYASAGFMAFNGAGQATVLWTSSVERTQLFTTGTYKVDSNCSGQMTLDADTVNNFYLSPDGASFTFTRISGDGVIGAEARWVSEALTIEQP